MRFRYSFSIALFAFATSISSSSAGYPVEEDGLLLDVTKQIQKDSDNISAKTDDMDKQLDSIEQLIQKNIQPDIETMRKIQVNQADIAMQMDKLAALKTRGQLLINGTSGGSGGSGTGGSGGTAPVQGYNWNSATQSAEGGGGGFADNYISPMYRLPFGEMAQAPSALFPVQSGALSGLLSVANSYGSSLLGPGNGGTGFGQSGGAASAITQSINSLFGNTGFNLSAQVNASSLSGAMMIGDNAFIRPAEGSGGSTDGAYAQLVNGGFGQVMAGTPANAFNFLAASAVGGTSQNYNPEVGTYNSGSNLINSILTNGASDTNPSAYANFNQIASLVAANPSQYLIGGTKLSITNNDVSNFQQMQQNGTAPSVSLDQYSIASILHKDKDIYVINVSSHWGFRTVQSSSVSGMMAIGPSIGTAGKLLSSQNSAGGRLSAMDLAKTTTEQYIQYTTQLLQDTLQIEQGLEQIDNSLADNEKNAIPGLAQMQTQIQDQIKSYQDKIQSMNAATEHLDQRMYNELKDYDVDYQAAIAETAQRAPILAHAASVDAQMNGGTDSSTYYDPLHGQRFVITQDQSDPRITVLALR